MNKYNAKKTTLCLICGVELKDYTCRCNDPYTFDSKREAKRYQELLLLMDGGVVKEIALQPEYTLLDAYEKNGKKVRPIKYRADFKVVYADGRVEIEDVKGLKTREFMLKEKLFNAKFEQELKIV